MLPEFVILQLNNMLSFLMIFSFSWSLRVCNLDKNIQLRLFFFLYVNSLGCDIFSFCIQYVIVVITASDAHEKKVIYKSVH